jgi:hypothetical protein
MKELEVLEQDFKRAKDRYEEFSTATAPKIKKSIMSKGFLFNVRTYEKESMGFKKGKEIKALPKNVNDVFVYHFDDKDRIVLIESYGSAPTIINREFCVYESASLKTYYYESGTFNLRNVTLSTEENSKTKQVFNYGMYGVTVKDYVYNKNAVLEKIQVKAKEHAKTDFEPHELVFTFDKEELVSVMQVYPNGYQKQIYKR